MPLWADLLALACLGAVYAAAVVAIRIHERRVRWRARFVHRPTHDRGSR